MCQCPPVPLDTDTLTHFVEQLIEVPIINQTITSPCALHDATCKLSSSVHSQLCQMTFSDEYTFTVQFNSIYLYITNPHQMLSRNIYSRPMPNS